MKFVVQATQTKHFEIPVEATNAAEAQAKIEDWIEDDFEDFQTQAEWQIEVGNLSSQGVSHIIRPPLRALDEESEQEQYEEARQQ